MVYYIYKGFTLILFNTIYSINYILSKFYFIIFYISLYIILFANNIFIIYSKYIFKIYLILIIQLTMFKINN